MRYAAQPGRLEVGQRWALPAQRAVQAGSVALVVFLPLVLYLRTLSPAVYYLDSDELRTAAATLGIAHAPGYPLYVLVGRLFALLPVGDVGYRLDLMSAIFAVLTVLVVYEIVWRLGRDRLAAVSAALTLALSYYFWANAILAEVYTLDTFLVAAIVLLLLRWGEKGRLAFLVAAALLLGLSLANRTTSALYVPAFVAYVACSKKVPSARVSALVVGAFLVGLLPYLYIPLRFVTGPEYVWPWYSVDLASWKGFWWMISAEMFRPLAFAYGLTDAFRQLWIYVQWLWGGFLGVGVVMGVVGIAHAWRHQRRALLLLVLLFVPQVIFYANYAAADKQTMFGPTWVVWAALAGLGLAVVARQVREQPRNRLLCWLVSSLMLLLPFLLIVVNLPLLT